MAGRRSVNSKNERFHGICAVVCFAQRGSIWNGNEQFWITRAGACNDTANDCLAISRLFP